MKHSPSFLEFQTKMGKVYTCFQNETAQKLYPLGWHIPMWHRRVAPLDVMLDA